MDLDKIAQIAFVKLSEQEKEICGNTINRTLENADKMLLIDMQNVQPTTKITRVDFIREDIIVTPSSREELLSNAKNSDEGAFVVPKIVE